MQNNLDPKKNISLRGYINAALIIVVFYIIYTSIIAIPTKYIFVDYFTRMGYIGNYSYITVVMAMLSAKFAYAFVKSSVRTMTSSNKS